MTALRTLAQNAASIRATSADVEAVAARLGEPAERLRPLFRLGNGFYAFEGALHVFSDVGNVAEKGLLEWNEEGLWRQCYEGLANDALFFAEDIFGTQFCVRHGAIAVFDPETGGFEEFAKDLEEWARLILEDHGLWTGHAVAHDWQAKFGPLAPGFRLVPITPFVFGGDDSVSNMYSSEAVKGMRYRAFLAIQIRDLPDGTRIRLQVP